MLLRCFSSLSVQLHPEHVFLKWPSAQHLIAYLQDGEALISSGKTFLSRSTNGEEPHVFPAAKERSLSDQSNTFQSVKEHSGYVHFHFLLIMSFSCLSLHPDSALCLLISDYIINNLHIISFVLIIFV